MPPPPKHVGVVSHPRREATWTVADRIAASLEAYGVGVWQFRSWDDNALEAIQGDTDLVVVVGGDGAMLRAARACSTHNVPVLGVNMGYLGFLPEVSDPDAWDYHLHKLMNGDYWVESRMMVEARVVRDGVTIASGEALNDVVVTRDRALGTVLLQTYIDNYWATTYHADALIIATPTGSTAYALAAGGPILPPELHNILIVPVAAHLSMDRAIVISEGSSVQVVISPERDNDTRIVLDGTELSALQPNDTVDIGATSNQGLFVRMRDRNYFYRSLLDRLEPRMPSRATPDPEHLQIQIDDA
ncbi:MAG: NAD(+)/NADH kinase [Chloroflexota bacterium]